MDKYTEALNNISNYEIWHTATYDDDGYCNDDDWTEYPFSESEDIKLLSELITKHDTLNKGIDKLLKKYEDKLNIVNEEIKLLSKYEKSTNEILQKNVLSYLLNDMVYNLKKLKGE